MSTTPMGEPGTAAGSPTTPRAALEALRDEHKQVLARLLRLGIDPADFRVVGDALDKARAALDKARAALAEAPAEAERCAFPGCDQQTCTHICTTQDHPDGPHDPVVSCHPFAPAPAPTAEALRDALVADHAEMGYGHGPVYARRIDEIIAAARQPWTALGGICIKPRAGGGICGHTDKWLWHGEDEPGFVGRHLFEPIAAAPPSSVEAPRGMRSVVGELIEHVRHYDVPEDPSYAAFVDAWADRIHAASGVPRMQQQMAEDRKALAAARQPLTEVVQP